MERSILITLVVLQGLGSWLGFLLFGTAYPPETASWFPYAVIVAGLLQPIGIATWTALNRHAVAERSFRLFAAAYMTASIAAVVPLFSVVYYSESKSERGCFNEISVSRPDAVYFTMTTFTTTGYGDIHPTSTPCRMVASIQMGVDLFLLVFIVAWSVGRALSSPEPVPND